MSSRPVALPPLLFGKEQVSMHTSAQAFADAVEEVFPGVNAYDPMPASGGVFRSLSAQVQLQGLSLINASISPTYVDRYKNRHLTVLLPISGDPDCSAKVGSDEVHWGRGQAGVLLPVTDERVIGTGGFRNQLMLQLDVQQLGAQAQSMLGTPVDASDLVTDHIRALPLYFGKFPLLQGLLQTLPLLHSYADQPQLLNALGVNELLLRQVVMLLRPDAFFMAPEPAVVRDVYGRKQLVQQLGEYMRAHLSEPLTLSDLEQFAGMSARTLQYAFRHVHGCTPMAWLREQRLVAAQGLLLSKPEMNVGQVALACGFPSASLFAQSYRKKFGNTPTAIRRKTF
jgi:AraC-like DNA-binding protein